MAIIWRFSRALIAIRKFIEKWKDSDARSLMMIMVDNSTRMHGGFMVCMYHIVLFRLS